LRIQFLTTFEQVFSPRPDCTLVEFMAWSLFGFPSGPLPVYILFSTKETAKDEDPTATLAVYPRSNCNFGINGWSLSFCC